MEELKLIKVVILYKKNYDHMKLSVFKLMLLILRNRLSIFIINILSLKIFKM